MRTWISDVTQHVLCHPSHTDTHKLDVLVACDDWSPCQVSVQGVLGRGRAAEARLVKVTVGAAEPRMCVEKVFRPGWLTRSIYRTVYQAPFAYQSTQDAILACYYRRRVASALVDAMIGDVGVAKPLYVRWDRDERAFVLGSEFVAGRGIRPAPGDRFVVRRWVFDGLFRCQWYGVPPRQEIDQLLDTMWRVEGLFRDSGLVGTGWQVCKKAMVSTANLLKTDAGYVAIDLESGIPALLVPYYVWTGLRLGRFPLFDDLDEQQLTRWLSEHRLRLYERLGHARHRQLGADAQQLVLHTRRWKASELALVRNQWRVFSKSARRHFHERVVETWHRRGTIDDRCADELRRHGRLYTRAVFWSGGLPGEAVQRFCGNRHFRKAVVRFLSDRTYRREKIGDYVSQHRAHWQSQERIPHGPIDNRLTVGFCVQNLLSHAVPAGVQRWLTDPDYRRNNLIRTFLLLVSARFQSEYSRHVIGQIITQWQRDGRLSQQEAQSLHAEVETNDLDEYLRCLGMHLSLKALTPLVVPAKIGGVAAFVTTGNAWYLVPFLVLPILRTLVTLWRMLHPHRRHIPYTEALIVGALPTVGSSAYQVQMYASHPELSTFLLRDSAARVGRLLPIYGGKDSRIEIWAIRMVDFLLEGLDILSTVTRRVRNSFNRLFGRRTQDAAAPVRIPYGRWAHAAEKQMRLIREKALTPSVEIEEPQSTHVKSA